MKAPYCFGLCGLFVWPAAAPSSLWFNYIRYLGKMETLLENKKTPGVCQGSFYKLLDSFDEGVWSLNQSCFESFWEKLLQDLAVYLGIS